MGMEASLSGELELLRRLYDHFNARDIEQTLATMHEDVVWANGLDGGYVHTHQGVRSYWTRQWAVIDPHVVPLGARPDRRCDGHCCRLAG
jgi:ketosteroid isomerase-like protein